MVDDGLTSKNWRKQEELGHKAARVFSADKYIKVILNTEHTEFMKPPNFPRIIAYFPSDKKEAVKGAKRILDNSNELLF